jgi:hypothetical protein
MGDRKPSTCVLCSHMPRAKRRAMQGQATPERAKVEGERKDAGDETVKSVRSSLKRRFAIDCVELAGCPSLVEENESYWLRQ